MPWSVQVLEKQVDHMSDHSTLEPQIFSWHPISLGVKAPVVPPTSCDPPVATSTLMTPALLFSHAGLFTAPACFPGLL